MCTALVLGYLEHEVCACVRASVCVWCVRKSVCMCIRAGLFYESPKDAPCSYVCTFAPYCSSDSKTDQRQMKYTKQFLFFIECILLDFNQIIVYIVPVARVSIA